MSPYVIAGWCGLITTALNTLPVGSLDGGRMVQVGGGLQEVRRGMGGETAREGKGLRSTLFSSQRRSTNCVHGGRMVRVRGMLGGGEGRARITALPSPQVIIRVQQTNVLAFNTKKGRSKGARELHGRHQHLTDTCPVPLATLV